MEDGARRHQEWTHEGPEQEDSKIKAEIEENIKAKMTEEQLKKISSSEDPSREWGKLVETYLEENLDNIISEFIQDYDQLDGDRMPSRYS